MASVGGDGNGVVEAGAIWRLTGNIKEAAIAELKHRRLDPGDYQHELGKVDTVGRVRVRPMSRAVESMLRQGPGDSLDDLYNPDAAIRRDFYKPAAEIARHAMVPVGPNFDPPMAHRIQLLQGFNTKTNLPILKEHIVRTAAELKALSETREYKRSRFREATGTWTGERAPDEGKYQEFVCDLPREGLRKSLREARQVLEKAVEENNDEQAKRLLENDCFAFGGNESGSGASVTRDADQEFIPILGGPYNKQLYLYDHWAMYAKCFEMKNHTELAKAAISIVTDFSLGRGVTWKIRNQAALRVWEEFWERNDMEMRLRRMCDDFTWQGELIIRRDFPLKGFMRVRAIDPSSIYEIVTNPVDIEEVYLYHQSFPTQYQLPYTSLNGVHLNVPLQKYVVQQFPPTEILHIKANVSSYEKWGRSDFYASLGTLKRHQDWLNATTLKDLLQANLVWKVKVEGDEADVQAYMNDTNNQTLPPFGGTWVENSAITLEPMHADMQSSSRMGQGSTGSFLTSLFATGQQMPLSYFNAMGSGPARATALVQGEPFAKKIATRQQIIQRMMDSMFEDVMKEALEAGRLNRDDIRGDDADPEWIFPATFEEDRGAKFNDLTTAYQIKAISHQAVATTMAQELGFDEYDYQDEQDQIANDPPMPGQEQQPGMGGALPPGADPNAAGPQQPGAGGPPLDENQQQELLTELEAMSPEEMEDLGLVDEESGEPMSAEEALEVLLAQEQQPGPAGGPPPPNNKQPPPQQGRGPQANKHEALAGADEKHRFRQQQRDVAHESYARPALSAEDRRFLESAIRQGVDGEVTCPSGARARIPRGT